MQAKPSPCVTMLEGGKQWLASPGKGQTKPLHRGWWNTTEAGDSNQPSGLNGCVSPQIQILKL